MIKDSDCIGVHIPEILVPAKDIDLTKWAVVACDQYTSQPEYWSEVESIVGDAPSSLRLIFPEIYIDKNDSSPRIEKIYRAMQKYIEDKTLIPLEPGFIFIERMIPCNNGAKSDFKLRKGLIISVDLEKYDYNLESQSLIRASEGTVIERLPPRIKIRENALIELPHIMLLLDDPSKTVIEPLYEKLKGSAGLYNVNLMMNSGSIKSYKICDNETIAETLCALKKLADAKAFKKKYAVGDDKGVLLFAVGDGNHSLATAKGHWENVKKTLSAEDQLRHPARYALVEVVNIHDDALVFEPIHRVLFNVNYMNVLKEMTDFFGNLGCYFKLFESKGSMEKEFNNLRSESHSHIFPFVTEKGFGLFVVCDAKCTLEVGTLQSFLDDYLKKDMNAKIDYIHGENIVDSLGSASGNMGFYLPPMNKSDLFKTVILDGVLPRKTFSMGEAEEKRFYLEGRKIK